MLSAVLLFIPLLAGYIFTVTWRYSRYRSAREDSQRLYFRAASYGVFLAALAFLTLFLVKLYCPKITTIATSICVSFVVRLTQKDFMEENGQFVVNATIPMLSKEGETNGST